MNMQRWKDLVADNEDHTLTLTLDQRNAIGDAAEYIEQLEHALSSCRYMATARQSPPSEVFQSICEIANRTIV